MVDINGVKISDIGFYINLDRRSDRKEILEKQLVDFNINGVKRHSANSSTSSGPVNCKLSHYEIYKKFLETDFETLLVLEDDCLFLPVLLDNYSKIFSDINSLDWDLFWLGCRNRRWPLFYKNNCYKVSSVSHTQSYIIKRKFIEHILENYPSDNFLNTAIDELLCLAPYGYDVVFDPNKYNFYNLDQPLNNLPTKFISLCYESSLTTQYKSYSDLWNTEIDISEYIKSSFPKP